MDTVFYAIGASLVVTALVVSAIGMRSENFPSNGVLRIGVLLVALVVIATGYTAVQASQDEQLAREDEANRLASEQALQAEAGNEAAGVSGSNDVPADKVPPPGGGPSDGSAAAPAASAATLEQGSAVFVDNGCGSCHTLADQGDQALGQIGPNLDAELVNQDADFIRTSIMEPSAEVETGFGDGIMPSNYAEQIAPADLDALVAYLDAVTNPSGGGK